MAAAVCIEEAPGSQEISDLNKELSAGCETLPNTGLDQVRFGSVACSHANMFLRCLNAGAASSDADLSDSGHLSLEKVKHCSAQFGRAAREGLEWMVLSHRVHAEHPTLLSVIQRARSAPPPSCCAGRA